MGIDREGRVEYAVRRFKSSMNCSQAVLETFAPAIGISVEMARKISAPFAGGMAIGAECGAVTGALMVIGMRYGKTTDRDMKADEQTFAKSTEFFTEFQARHGHMVCSRPLETDTGTAEGLEKAKLQGHFTHRCPHFVASSVKILEDILDWSVTSDPHE